MVVHCHNQLCILPLPDLQTDHVEVVLYAVAAAVGCCGGTRWCCGCGFVGEGYLVDPNHTQTHPHHPHLLDGEVDERGVYPRPYPHPQIHPPLAHGGEGGGGGTTRSPRRGVEIHPHHPHLLDIHPHLLIGVVGLDMILLLVRSSDETLALDLALVRYTHPHLRPPRFSETLVVVDCCFHTLPSSQTTRRRKRSRGGRRSGCSSSW